MPLKIWEGEEGVREMKRADVADRCGRYNYFRTRGFDKDETDGVFF
jgi:hypothetical protein